MVEKAKCTIVYYTGTPKFLLKLPVGYMYNNVHRYLHLVASAV